MDAHEVAVNTFVCGVKASPARSLHPKRKLFPVPCTMLVGMQFGMLKEFSTKGPFALPRFGLITSTVPYVRSEALAFELVTRKRPELGLNADPPMPAIATAPKQPADGGA